MKTCIHKIMPIFSRILIGSCILAAPFASAFPDKPVTIVVPTTAGGIADTLARLIANKLAQVWGQTVIVENRTGAGTLIGTQYVMRSKPDGHTLMIGFTDVATLPLMNKNISIDVVKELEPISRLASLPLLILGSPQVEAKNLPELIGQMKKNPKKYTYSSNGNASILQLYTEMFSHEVGVKLLHIPYKGAVEATRALVSGEVDFLIQGATGNVLGHVGAGRVKPYAVLSQTRLKSLPDVQTIAELGMPQLETEVWYGLFAPAGISKAIVNQINTDIQSVLKSEDIQKRLADFGVNSRVESAADFGTFFRQENRHWDKVIRDAGIEVN
jgi:tripartite-type tricarboxylate transporter receptor subunit TctC